MSDQPDNRTLEQVWEALQAVERRAAALEAQVAALEAQVAQLQGQVALAEVRRRQQEQRLRQVLYSALAWALFETRLYHRPFLTGRSSVSAGWWRRPARGRAACPGGARSPASGRSAGVRVQPHCARGRADAIQSDSHPAAGACQASPLTEGVTSYLAACLLLRPSAVITGSRLHWNDLDRFSFHLTV